MTEQPLEGLIAHLMRTHRISFVAAEKRAKWIIQKQAERAAAKKVRLASSQLCLPIDGEPDEVPHNDSGDGPYGPVPF